MHLWEAVSCVSAADHLEVFDLSYDVLTNTSLTALALPVSCRQDQVESTGAGGCCGVLLLGLCPEPSLYWHAAGSLLALLSNLEGVCG